MNGSAWASDPTITHHGEKVKMNHVYHALIWVCITIMFHDLMSGVVNILNTVFVERIKVRMAEIEAVRLEAQADIIKDRERRRLKSRDWDRVA